jgi:hypothetical protein
VKVSKEGKYYARKTGGRPCTNVMDPTLDTRAPGSLVSLEAEGRHDLQ